MNRSPLVAVPLVVTVPLAVAAFVGPLASPAAAQFTFETPAAIETNVLARRTLVGDLNEDGLPDLVTGGMFVFPIFGFPSVCFGTAPGAFGPPQVAPLPRVFRLADFDEDGHLDLLGSSGGPENENAVSVCLGDGRGGFGTALGISVGASMQDPDDADVADFDGDGHLDVAVHTGIEPFLLGRIMVIFGNGDGSFDTPTIPVPFAQTDSGHEGKLRAGDVDGDGLPDIVYTTGHSSPTLLSLGNGSFTLVNCANCGVTGERDFQLADVNGDGRDDAVTTLRVHLADEGGSFDAGESFPSSGFPFAVAVDDLDGDGTLDVALGRNGIAAEFDTSATAGDVLLLRGVGDGSFQTPGLVVSHVPQPRSLTAADLDLDGRTDLVAAGFQTALATRILFNRAYESGSPFLDLGGALGGSNGFPIQIASGTLLPGQPFAFQVASGPPNGAAFHIVGFSRIDAPFKGGVMIPAINLVNGPFGLDAAGQRTLAGNWPAGGSGLSLFVQFWMPNGGGPFGFVASTGVRAQIP